MTDRPTSSDVAREFARLGGSARSPRKTAANREKARQFWADVRAGKRPAPRRARHGEARHGEDQGAARRGTARRGGAGPGEEQGTMAHGAQ